MLPVDLNLITVALLAGVTFFVVFRKKEQPVPPGPPALPLLGNMFDLPQRESWKVYLQWGKTYSTLMTTSIGFQTK